VSLTQRCVSVVAFSMSSGAFRLPPPQPQAQLQALADEEGRTMSLMEMPTITATTVAGELEDETHHSPLKRTHSRSKSYAGHEKVLINEVHCLPLAHVYIL
jgi:hypothetical protein